MRVESMHCGLHTCACPLLKSECDPCIVASRCTAICVLIGVTARRSLLYISTDLDQTRNNDRVDSKVCVITITSDPLLINCVPGLTHANT